jgi:hypothetical protein
MMVALPALSIAFAAFCVWLGVRVYNRRERWAKWTLAGAVALPVLYVLSIGPAILLVYRSRPTGPQIANALYRPIFIAAEHHDEFKNLLRRYIRLFANDHRPMISERGIYGWSGTWPLRRIRSDRYQSDCAKPGL